MTNEFYRLKKELEELKRDSNIVESAITKQVIAEAIEKLEKEIEDFAPNGYVYADVTLVTGELLKKAEVYSVYDRMGDPGYTDIKAARDLFESADKVYLQTQDDKFSGDVDVSEIDKYKLYYDGEIEDQIVDKNENVEKSGSKIRLTRTLVYQYVPKSENYDDDMTIEEMANYDANHPEIKLVISEEAQEDSVIYEIIK